MADQNYTVDKDQPIGLDDDIKRLLKEEAEGPTIRYVPSALDQFKAAGGTADKHQLDVMHSVPNTGNLPDVEATATKSKTSKSNSTTSEQK